MNEPCNIAARLPQLARERPDQIAIRCPGRSGPGGMAAYDVALDYRSLDTRSDAIAAGLARATVRSAAAGLEGEETVQALIARVASPGGTTEAGLKALTAEGLDAAVEAAVAAARARAEALSR